MDIYIYVYGLTETLIVNHLTVF